MNSSGLGMLGERMFADFRQAAKFKGTGSMPYRQANWTRGFSIRPWFRRFYFDGVLSGRFEFGFFVTDDVEDRLARVNGHSHYEPGAITDSIETAPLMLRGPSLAAQETLLVDAGPSLGLAYVAATTKTAFLNHHPPGESYGRHVAIGPLLVHMRIAASRQVLIDKKYRRAAATRGNEFFVAARGTKHGHMTILVQKSDSPTLDEPPHERVVRVLFSNLNSLIHALSHCIRMNKEGMTGLDRAALLNALSRLVKRLSGYSAQPSNWPAQCSRPCS